MKVIQMKIALSQLANAVLLAVLALSPSIGFSQDSKEKDPYYIAPDKVISYTKDVRPILNNKCVGCHACFDSPAQLNLTNSLGLKRGAIKLDPYALRWDEITPIFLENTSKSVEDFREIGFFSVLEGGKDSLLGKMIKLGYEHQWKPNERIPENIDINSMTHRLFASTLKEFSGYEAAYPKQGMPFAIAGLKAGEYATLMKWLEQGAPFDDVAPQASKQEAEHVAKWEEFLNSDDKREKLVSRYMYEHLWPLHLYFGDVEDGYPNFFQLVRSTTPPGQPIKPIETRYANDLIQGEWFYRLNPVHVTLHHKRHMPVNMEGKLDVYKEIFFSEDWTVDELPGYTIPERYTPLAIFSAIPAKARYLFLLEESFHFEKSITQGASCRTGIIVSVTAEHAWHVYENPETSLYVNDPEFRAAFDEHFSRNAEFVDAGKAAMLMKEFLEINLAYRESVAETKGTRSRIRDIWSGSKPSHVPGHTQWRHDNTAFNVPGLIGDYPKRVNVQDFPLFERRIYCAYVNFDLFGAVPPMIGQRVEFGLWLTGMEANFLRFLPQETRVSVLKDLYRGPAAQAILAEGVPADYGAKIPAEIEYKTDDPKREFIDKLVRHLSDKVETNDPIARPESGVAYDEVTQAMQLINKRGDADGKFKLYLPEATFIRVVEDGKLKDLYTLTLDWQVSSMFSLAAILTRTEPMSDRVTIAPGVGTSYPNFMFTIEKNEALEFAKALDAVKDRDDFVAVVDRWGVRRTNPSFWETLHSVTEFERGTSPRKAAAFDVNRYIDY